MSTPSSTPSPNRSRRTDLVAIVATGLVALGSAGVSPAAAQVTVYDPTNYVQNALQAARQLESLTNEARSLAASPYSHLAGSNQSLRDMTELARAAQGMATSVTGLERQFRDLYPDDLAGADMQRLLQQGQARTANARRTARDVAYAAAELERLGTARQARLSGALEASQAAQGQTAAVQSTNQLLAVLAEDLAALRTIMLAQSRLLAEQTARAAADQASGDERRRRRWQAEAVRPAAPRFDPLSRAEAW